MKILPEEIENADSLEWKEIREVWNEYTLEDGSTLKIRLVLTGVKRLKRHNPDGTPIYIINSQNVVRAINIPKTLKTKPFKPKTSESTFMRV